MNLHLLRDSTFNQALGILFTMRTVLLKKQPVDLYKLLKFEGLANSGGEAKALISEGLVKLNGRVETRKRKKIIDGDSLQVAELKLRVRLDPELSALHQQSIKSAEDTDKEASNKAEIDTAV